MDLGLKGRAALVTGAGGGIGSAIVRDLAREGCALGLVDHPSCEATSAVAQSLSRSGGRGKVFATDVRDFSAAEAVVAEFTEEFGGLDVLVCCAGITRDSVSWKMSEEAFDEVIDVNLKGVFNYNRAAALRFRERDWGRIVNITSINGMRGKFGQANYAASKGGVIALSKSLARELGRFQVTVNCVAPGLVLTDMARSIPDEFLEAARAESVVGRLARPEDISGVVTFLCSEVAQHISGEVLRVDGGQYI